MANYDDWLDQVKEQAGNDFDHLADWYSFREAWKDGIKPSEAIDDAKEWIDD